MRRREQNSTSHPILFFMADESDHLTGLTGLTPAVTLSKNGGSFGAAEGAVSEVGNGWYALAGDADDRDTLGTLIIHAEATGADTFDMDIEILASDPPTTTEINSKLVVEHGDGQWGPGSGSRANPYTVYESDGTTPMAGCEVWATSDLAGTTEIANRGLTNDAGQHIFYFDLDVGTTVYIWRRKSGETFTNPDTEVVA